MGVVNVTPDSFSDGGRYADTAAAVAHGRALLADGADILDIGGESTRPGATRPLVAEELDRVVPVIEALWPPTGRGRRSTPCAPRSRSGGRGRGHGSSTTSRAGSADPDDPRASWPRPRATYVAMHWRAHSDRMADLAAYDEPGGVVGARSATSWPSGVAAIPRPAGSPDERVVLDPGLGFAKRGRAQLGAAAPASTSSPSLGFPLLVGASRKSFLGTLLGRRRRAVPRPVDEPGGRRPRADACVLAQRGVWGVRVHDVRGTRDVLRVVAVPDAADETGTQ